MPILFLLRPLSCIKRRRQLKFVIIKFHTKNWFEKQHLKYESSRDEKNYPLKMMEAQIEQMFTIVICSLQDKISVRCLLPRLH